MKIVSNIINHYASYIAGSNHRPSSSPPPCFQIKVYKALALSDPSHSSYSPIVVQRPSPKGKKAMAVYEERVSQLKWRGGNRNVHAFYPPIPCAVSPQVVWCPDLYQRALIFISINPARVLFFFHFPHFFHLAICHINPMSWSSVQVQLGYKQTNISTQTSLLSSFVDCTTRLVT